MLATSFHGSSQLKGKHLLMIQEVDIPDSLSMSICQHVLTGVMILHGLESHCAWVVHGMCAYSYTQRSCVNTLHRYMSVISTPT
jgi:hypothetical protein